MIKILFDNHCSLCRREINYYKSIAPKGKFLWCDLHRNSSLLCKYKISQNEALLSLHAIDENKKLHKGIDAFCVIWNEIQGWRLISLIVKAPIIYSLSKKLYAHFTIWRVNKLNYCELN